MSRSKIIAIETDNPPLKCAQAEALQHILKNSRVSSKALPWYQRFLSDEGIQTRYLGMDHISVVDDETPDQANHRFQTVATKIGTSAVQKCLKVAGISAEKVDGLVVTTCTGYLCPGLTSYISQAIGLRPDIYALDLVGVGCAAAIPALRAADHYLRTRPGSYVVVLSVEVCTAAITWGDDVDLILSNCIFGDGAAACLLGNIPDKTGLTLDAFDSVLWPEYREDLRFQQENGRLRNVIGSRVPEIAAMAVKTLHENLAGHGSREFDHYAIHPGGRRILDAIQSGLTLDNSAMMPSRGILKDYGNMSSPSILFVVKRILDGAEMKNKDSLIMFSFGAGFSAFGALLTCVKIEKPVNAAARAVDLRTAKL